MSETLPEFRVDKCARCGHAKLEEEEIMGSTFLVCERCGCRHNTLAQLREIYRILRGPAVLLDEFKVYPLRSENGTIQPDSRKEIKMSDTERKQPLAERLARHFPEGWTVTVEGDGVHISDGESPSIWEAFVSLTNPPRGEFEIVRQTIAALHCDLKSLGGIDER